MKFNENTEEFEAVSLVAIDGTVSTPNNASNIAAMYEDKYGTVWSSLSGGNQPEYYDGVRFNRTWSETALGVSFYGCKIFELDGDEYFIKNGVMYRFAGDSIKRVTDGFNGTITNAVGYVQDGVKYLFGYNGTTATLYRIVGSSVETVLESTSADVSLNYANSKQIDDAIYFYGNGKTYKVENDTLNEAASTTLKNFQKIEGEIYATNTSNLNVYKLSGDTFEQIATTTASTDLAERDGLIYIIPHYASYNTGSELAVQTYNIKTGELLTSTATVKYSLGGGYYWSAAALKVYNFKENTEDDISLSKHTGYSTGCSLVINNSSTNSQILYIA